MILHHFELNNFAVKLHSNTHSQLHKVVRQQIWGVVIDYSLQLLLRSTAHLRMQPWKNYFKSYLHL